METLIDLIARAKAHIETSVLSDGTTHNEGDCPACLGIVTDLAALSIPAVPPAPTVEEVCAIVEEWFAGVGPNKGRREAAIAEIRARWGKT